MSLKEKLIHGDLCLGSWITLAHPAIAEIMARAGFDWLAVDLEHSVITIRETEDLIRTIELCGAAPLVRLTSNDSNLIKRVMDAGSHGVIVPLINSRKEAEKAIESIYYPPKGYRGVGLARAQGYGTSFTNYLESLPTKAVIIVMIEHIEAVNNVEEILSLGDVDGYIMGPYDLSASLGIPGKFDRPEFIEAVEHVKKIADRLKKPGGLHVIEPHPEELEKRIQEGFRFLAYSLDIRMIDRSCQIGLESIQKHRNIPHA